PVPSPPASAGGAAQASAQTMVPAVCSRSSEHYTILFRALPGGGWLAEKTFKRSSGEGDRPCSLLPVRGRVYVDARYPGCPYCSSPSFFFCTQCRRVNCTSSARTVAGGRTFVTCRLCGRAGNLRGGMEEMEGGAEA